MTSPPTRIELDCPRCDEHFEAYYRRSINISLGDTWTEEELRDASTATCPRCGFVVELETLVVVLVRDVLTSGVFCPRYGT